MDRESVDRLSWLTGHWRGPAFGGTGEEIWGPPSAQSVLGMYRLIKDDRVVFYELLAIVEERDGLVMRLRHFNPDFKGWEEKDEPLSFPLVELKEREATFGGITYRRADEKTLRIRLSMKKKDGSVEDETHEYYRVDPP